MKNKKNILKHQEKIMNKIGAASKKVWNWIKMWNANILIGINIVVILIMIHALIMTKQQFVILNQGYLDIQLDLSGACVQTKNIFVQETRAPIDEDLCDEIEITISFINGGKFPIRWNVNKYGISMLGFTTNIENQENGIVYPYIGGLSPWKFSKRISFQKPIPYKIIKNTIINGNIEIEYISINVSNPVKYIERSFMIKNIGGRFQPIWLSPIKDRIE